MFDKTNVTKWHVLIVDDEPDSLEVARRVLEFHGAKVQVASNGRDALALVRQSAPTLILSDLSMPQMDGWELVYQLQSDPHTSAIPVVALTAHAMSGDRERAVGAGFHYYLTKPLSPRTFLEDILRLFAEHPVVH